MGRHSRPRTRAAHRRGNRGLARLVVILAAVLTLGTALYLSNMARDAALDGVSTPAPTTVSTPTTTMIPVPVPIPVTVTVEPTPFPDCDAAHAAGVPLIPQGDPRYVAAQDHDGDGWACDRHGDPPTPPPPALPVCLPPP